MLTVGGIYSGVMFGYESAANDPARVVAGLLVAQVES
jgi:hypothetical protein